MATKDSEGKKKLPEITRQTAIQVWAAAAGRCSFCKQYLAVSEETGQSVPIGQLAHIVGKDTTPGSPRGDHAMPLPERALPENLILLCYGGHKTVDTAALWSIYSENRLRQLKRTHEYEMTQLTGMTRQAKSVVLRINGTVHGSTKAIDNQSVVNALLDRGRFPDFALMRDHEFEIDLRALPGEQEGTPAYYESVRHVLKDRMTAFNAYARQSDAISVSVFAFARIPVLIAAGSMLDDKVPAELFALPRDQDGRWGWAAEPETISFIARTVREGAADSVAVLFSISGSVDQNKLPAELGPATLYEISPADVLPARDIINGQATLDNFSSAWRSLLAAIERAHSGAVRIGIVGALPLTAGLSVGRQRMAAAHPPFAVYDILRDSDTYAFQVEVN